MKFTELALPGAHLIEVEPIYDSRGFFARSWCTSEFQAQGLVSNFVQSNISYNQQKSILRGLHYQAEPHGEVKIVRCTQGVIFDVLVDLRPHSPTFKKWIGYELSAQNRRMLYLPEGIAHGFQTLTPESEVFYQMSQFYNPTAARGVRWDDPALGISWPDPTHPVLSERDRTFPDFAP